MERKRDKSREIIQKEFLVSTGKKENRPLAESKSIRHLEAQMMSPSHQKSFHKVKDGQRLSLGMSLNSSINISTLLAKSPFDRDPLNASIQSDILSKQLEAPKLKPALQIKTPLEEKPSNTQSRVYFKSIEMSESYLNLKQAQKHRVKEDIAQMKT